MALSFSSLNMRALGATSLLAIGGAVPFASAQDGESFGLEEIIVTAQRRQETVQDAAIPVDAIGSDEISRLGLDSADGLGQLSPALGIAGSGGALRSVFIRGVGSITTNALLDAAVAQNYDGVYLGRPSAASSLSLYDLERVEILKGPQGTLYGRNATGGVVNYIPATPVLGENSGFVQAELGNYSKVGLQGAGNFSLGESTAVRVSANVLERDGYSDDGSNDAELYSIRAQLLTEFTEDLSLRVSVDHSENGGVGSPGGDLIGVFNTDPEAGLLTDFTPSGLSVDSGPASDGANAVREGAGRRAVLPSELHQDLSYSGVLAELNYEMDAGTLTIVPSYRESEEDYTFVGPGFSAAPTYQEHEQMSLETRFATDLDGSFNGVFGAFVYEEDLLFSGTFSQDNVAPVQNYTTTNSSWAVFASGTFDVTDSFRINLGGRYTEDEKEAGGESLVLIGLSGPLPSFSTPDEFYSYIGRPGATLDDFVEVDGPPFPVLGGPGGALGLAAADILTREDASFSDDEFTYRVGLEFDVAEDSLLYLNYEIGYRSGGVDINPVEPTYASESIDAYTLGLKNRFFDNTLQLNVEAFYWEYQDQQVSYFALDPFGGPSFQTANGSSTIQGLDVDVVWAVSESTTIGGQVQFLDSTFDELEFFSAEGTGRYGCDMTDVRMLGDGFNYQFFDCSGQNLQYSPEVAVDLNFEHVFDLGEFDLIGNADVSYRDEQTTDFSQVEELQTDAYTTLDLTLTLASKDSDWSVSFFGRNVTDERYLAASNLSGGSGLAFGLSNAPATYGVRFRMDY